MVITITGIIRSIKIIPERRSLLLPESLCNP